MGWKELVGKFRKKSSKPKEAIIDRWATQLPGVDESSQRQKLVIGLDFGTAFTKVVIGEQRVHFPIPFQIGQQPSTCYLPCVVYLSPLGECSLESQQSWKRITNLKIALLDKTCNEEKKKQIIAFLALALRHVRLWLFLNKASIYANKYIDWHLNIGLPTDDYHDTNFESFYRELVQAAWLASVCEGAVSTGSAASCLDEVQQAKDHSSPHALPIPSIIHPEKIGCFPEFVAQVAGYVRSPFRRGDLHMLVDVGAGTLDVTVFNVHEHDGEDVFPIFAKAVQPLGSAYLIRHRMNSLGRKKDEIDPISPVPPDEDFAKAYGLTVERVSDIDESFRKKVRILVAGELKQVKLHRHCKSIHWKIGVPSFLCGGGSNVPLYREVLRVLEKPEYPFRIRLGALPYPENLDGDCAKKTEYYRMLVAYGLSFDAFDLGGIIKYQDINDDRGLKKKEDIEDRFVSKDMV